MKAGTLYQLTTAGETRDLGSLIDNKEEDFISMYWTHVAGGASSACIGLMLLVEKW